MSQSIGKLVQTRRSEVGFSHEELAELARVPLATLEAFEAGQGNITAAALDRVAYVLGVDAGVLRQGRIERSPTAALFFRQGAFADFRDVEDRPKIVEAFERALALRKVNTLLGRPPSLRERFEPEEPTPEVFKDGYRLARKVRSVLGDETGPLGDMAELLEEEFDVLVRAEALSSAGIDALSLKEPQTGVAAAILNTASRRRSNAWTARVDLAHELGHILFDPPQGEIHLVIDREDDENKGVWHAERRARAFAAELLMPAEGLRQLLGPPRYEMALSRALDLMARVREEFRTPIEITVNHLINREYIVHFLQEAVIEQAKRTGRGGAAATPPPHPARQDALTRRVLEALDRDLISAGRARELLLLTAWDDLPAKV
ncbi:helix-turn-helix domain-containing protein [Sorangium sp. So ce513]|uniref:helix-turn-helix domain-containing protein n=1 Tax=Sorangium sp. So ce513 TaxID=3133315 RepID=UPI003F5F49EB